MTSSPYARRSLSAVLLALGATLSISACASGSASTATTSTDASVAPSPQQITMASGQNVRFNTTSTTIAVSEIIPVGADSAYNLLLKVFADLQIPTTNLDSRQRMAGNSLFKVRRRLGGVTLSKYVDCGNKDGGSNAETYDLVLTINSAVGGSGPAASTISTRVDGVATHPVFSTQTTCSTTGELEKRIALAVKTKAGRS